MQKIYLDNGSTSFPKAPGVGAAMGNFIENIGVNIARGGYEAAYSAAETVLETREQLCRLFGFSKPENVVFTSGVTASLNMVLKGFLRPGDTVAATSMEHNAVMRPLKQLESMGVRVEVIPCENDGSLPPERIEAALKSAPKAMVMTHASNVCGTLLPVQNAAALCRKAGTKLIVDSAQSAGLFPLEMDAWGIDCLCFAGHKGLLGPQGIGGFLITPDMAKDVTPLLAGGTGSQSHMEDMPPFMPDRFEAGTQNLPGIYGLNAALRYLERTGIDAIRRVSLARTGELLQGLSEISGIRIVGKPTLDGRTAVVSVDFQNIDNAAAAFRLENEFGILTRCGLHCAPNAHKVLGTFPGGTVRLSFGIFNTEDDVTKALDAIKIVSNTP